MTIFAKKKLRIISSIIILILIFTVLPIRGESGIYESVIRLHILASSNSDTDQEMKLYVRDKVLAECAEELVTYEENAKAAYEKLSQAGGLDRVQSVAESALLEFCSENELEVPSVRCEIGKEKYPTKGYESLCFPSGEYYSLRIIIGEGGGQNWWCVLFPPLCFAAASENGGDASEDDFISVGLTPDQYNVISGEEDPQYRIRFRILEWIEGLFD